MKKFLRPEPAQALESTGRLRIAENASKGVREVIRTSLQRIAVKPAGGLISAEWMPTNLIGAGESDVRVFGKRNFHSGEQVGYYDLICALREQAGMQPVPRADFAERVASPVKNDQLAEFAKRAGITEQQLRSQLANAGLMEMKPALRVTASAKGYALDPEVAKSVNASVLAAFDTVSQARHSRKTQDLESTTF